MKKSLLVVNLLLVFAFLLVACGGSSNDIAVGSPAPDFSLVDSDGNTVTLAEYEDRPVLLFFHMAGG